MESVEEVDVLVICGILSELRTTSTLFTPLWVCYARPAHAYLNLSPGLDFETRIFHKPALAAVLARELSAPGYRCRVLHVGGNTDPYQPAERSLRSTRALLEPLAASPRARLRVMQQLTAAGVPVSAMIAPVIPAITDHEIERMLEAVAAAGVRRAGFLMLRLPFEVAGLFEAWLREHYPDRADKVLNLVRGMHDGKLNDPGFGHRHRGFGPYATLIGSRFETACRRLGLNAGQPAQLDTTQFLRESGAPRQGELFDGA